MNILYFVASEGNGHRTRSQAIIKRLKKNGHTITAVTGNKATSIIGDVTDKIIEVPSLGITYKNNKVLALKTFYENLKLFTSMRKAHKRIKEYIKQERINLIINDFSPYPIFIKNIPLISIDNQNMITEGQIKLPRGGLIEYLKSFIVVKCISPRANLRLITTFFYPTHKERSYLIGPILRDDIRELKPKKGRHILVYQTSPTYNKLFDLLSQTELKIIAYNAGNRENTKNITFKEFNNDEWFEDLANAKAIISNGGLSLMQEAIFLKKPCLAIPVKRQFEQMLNAYYLNRMGLGMSVKNATQKNIQQFITKLPAFERQLQTYGCQDGVQQAVDHIESFIRKVS